MLIAENLHLSTIIYGLLSFSFSFIYFFLSLIPMIYFISKKPNKIDSENGEVYALLLIICFALSTVGYYFIIHNHYIMLSFQLLMSLLISYSFYLNIVDLPDEKTKYA